MTAPALYDHFGSKDALLRAVAAQGYAELGELFDKAPGSRAIDRCRARARQYVDFAQEHPELFRLMFLYRPSAILMPVDNELPAASTTFEKSARDVNLAVADGDLVGRDTTRLNLTIWAAMHGVASVALMSSEVASQVVDDVIDAIFSGLRPLDRPQPAG